MSRADRVNLLVARVALAINGANSEEEALSAALRAACDVMGWPAGHAWLGGDAGDLRPTPAWVLPRGWEALRAAADGEAYTVARAVHSRAELAQTPGWIADLLTDPTFRRKKVAAALGIASGGFVPLRTGPTLLGVLEFFSTTRGAPEPEVLTALADVATLVATTVTRLRNLAFHETVIQHVAHPIFVKDRNYRFVLLNRAFTQMVGRDAADMLGRTDYDFFPREQADFFREKDRQMFESGSTVAVDEEPLTDANGRLHWLATTKVPVCDSAGRVTTLVGIIHDITAQHEAEESLRAANAHLAAEVQERTEANARLDIVNRELEAFSYSVSHDLRAPLRAIDGFTQVVLDEYGPTLEPGAQRYLERVRAGAQRMSRLIDDLLGLARVSRAVVRVERVDLAELAREVVCDLRRLEPERHVEVDIAPDLVTQGDPQLLRIVAENLVGNAWKFTSGRSGSRIEVGARQQDGERVFYVRDNGVGFDGELASSLFTPFRRLHPASQFPGSGVGLATVQRIVHRHGGRVWAEGAVDQGATFSFTLPGG